ncbi:MAG: geranylgeranylglyceryl/heptaprenylglyceryl phosphate synthase [Microscillaceae bacterium]
MQSKILPEISARKKQGLKSLALLIDPDKFEEKQAQALANIQAYEQADLLLVGGSLINGANIGQTIQLVKQYTTRPVVIFPGSNMHIDWQADGILFLSLISGRNPEFLIGQHIIAAPFLKKSRLEVISTGYMLVEGGKATTVSYISHTNPIPHDKPEVAACTAMAAEMLGMSLIYADAGSGATRPVSPKMIQAIRKAIEVPLLIGGGIRSADLAEAAWRAGADMIVVGNAIESQPELLSQISQRARWLNQNRP